MRLIINNIKYRCSFLIFALTLAGNYNYALPQEVKIPGKIILLKKGVKKKVWKRKKRKNISSSIKISPSHISKTIEDKTIPSVDSSSLKKDKKAWVETNKGFVNPDSLKIIALDVNKHPLPVLGFNHRQNSLYINFSHKSSIQEIEDSLSSRFRIQTTPWHSSPGVVYSGDIASFIGNVFTLFIPYNKEKEKKEKLELIRKLYLTPPDTMKTFEYHPNF